MIYPDFCKAFKWIILSICLVIPYSYSNEKDFQEVISPSISIQCKNILKNHDAKMLLKTKALNLIGRYKKIKEKIPEEKLKIKRKLLYIFNLVNQQYHIITDQITRLDEEIVRKGCPGVVL